jgi:tetratricopeptide (TPR) repeat protein
MVAPATDAQTEPLPANGDPLELLRQAEDVHLQDPVEARKLATKALGLAECLADPSPGIRALQMLGTIAYQQNNSAEAVENFSEVLNLLEKHESVLPREFQNRMRIQAYSRMGHVYNFLFADYEGALTYYMRAISLAENVGLGDATAAALLGSGFVYRNREEY